MRDRLPLNCLLKMKQRICLETSNKNMAYSLNNQFFITGPLDSSANGFVYSKSYCNFNLNLTLSLLSELLSTVIGNGKD